MLKAICGSETVQHLCETYKIGGEIFKSKEPFNPGNNHGVAIHMHDVHPYIFVEKTKQIIPISYCPYCGVYLDGEERP